MKLKDIKDKLPKEGTILKDLKERIPFQMNKIKL